MKEQLQAIVTVLSLVNPAICGAMFAQIEQIALAVSRWRMPPRRCWQRR